MATKSINLGRFTTLNGQNHTIYLMPEGETDCSLKFGSRGKKELVAMVYGQLPKNETRKLRKALRTAGYGYHAGLPRRGQLSVVSV